MRHERAVRFVLIAAATLLLAACATGGTSRPASMSKSTSIKAPSNSQKEKTEAAANYTTLGRRYLEQGKLEQSLENLQKALAKDAAFADAHTVVALLYQRIGDNAQAEEHYRRAAQLKPKAGNENNNYGAFLCNLGRFDEAAGYFEKAVADPFYQTPVVALTNAGTCAIKGGKLDAAERDLRAALDRGPDNPEALFQMASVLYRKDNFFRARAFIQRYEAVAQASAESLLLGRNIELRLGNSSAAQDYTKRLRERFPESEQVRALDAPSSS